jgi:hypothetical protein
MYLLCQLGILYSLISLFSFALYYSLSCSSTTVVQNPGLVSTVMQDYHTALAQEHDKVLLGHTTTIKQLHKNLKQIWVVVQNNDLENEVLEEASTYGCRVAKRTRNTLLQMQKEAKMQKEAIQAYP